MKILEEVNFCYDFHHLRQQSNTTPPPPPPPPPSKLDYICPGQFTYFTQLQKILLQPHIPQCKSYPNWCFYVVKFCPNGRAMGCLLNILDKFDCIIMVPHSSKLTILINAPRLANAWMGMWTRSSLVPVMAYCNSTPSHHKNQCYR